MNDEDRKLLDFILETHKDSKQFLSVLEESLLTIQETNERVKSAIVILEDFSKAIDNIEAESSDITSKIVQTTTVRNAIENYISPIFLQNVDFDTVTMSEVTSQKFADTFAHLINAYITLQSSEYRDTKIYEWNEPYYQAINTGTERLCTYLKDLLDKWTHKHSTDEQLLNDLTQIEKQLVSLRVVPTFQRRVCVIYENTVSVFMKDHVTMLLQKITKMSKKVRHKNYKLNQSTGFLITKPIAVLPDGACVRILDELTSDADMVVKSSILINDVDDMDELDALLTSLWLCYGQSQYIRAICDQFFDNEAFNTIFKQVTNVFTTEVKNYIDRWSERLAIHKLGVFVAALFILSDSFPSTASTNAEIQSLAIPILQNAVRSLIDGFEHLKLNLPISVSFETFAQMLFYLSLIATKAPMHFLQTVAVEMWNSMVKLLRRSSSPTELIICATYINRLQIVFSELLPENSIEPLIKDQEAADDKFMDTMSTYFNEMIYVIAKEVTEMAQKEKFDLHEKLELMDLDPLLINRLLL